MLVKSCLENKYLLKVSRLNVLLVRLFNGEIILRYVGVFFARLSKIKLNFGVLEHPYSVVGCASSYDFSSPNLISY